MFTIATKWSGFHRVAITYSRERPCSPSRDGERNHLKPTGFATSVEHIVMQTLSELACKIHECDGTDGDGVVALYVKGIVDSKEFIAAVREYMEYAGIEPDRPLKPRIAYWRNIPNRKDGGSIFKNAKRGSRGSFTVTVCDLRDWVA